MDEATLLPLPGAAPQAQLFAALYSELHRLARAQVRRYGVRDSLGTTTLLHDAFLTLSQREQLDTRERGAFLAYSARAMRGMVIDHLRRRHARKRGGAVHLTSLDTDLGDALAMPVDPVQLGDALEALSQAEPELAQIVDLKFFCGFSFAQIAQQRGVSERTVQRQWQKARLYLYHVLECDR